MLVICNDDLVDPRLHKVGADTLARAVALTPDEGAMLRDIGVELLYGLQPFLCRTIAPVLAPTMSRSVSRTASS